MEELDMSSTYEFERQLKRKKVLRVVLILAVIAAVLTTFLLVLRYHAERAVMDEILEASCSVQASSGYSSSKSASGSSSTASAADGTLSYQSLSAEDRAAVRRIINDSVTVRDLPELYSWYRDGDTETLLAYAEQHLSSSDLQTLTRIYQKYQ
jgi:cytoskeletal protein RodZ